MQNFNVSLQKNNYSTLTQAVSSWLNSDSNNDQHDSTLTRLYSLLFNFTILFFIFTDDLTLTRLIWVRVESNLTHDSWVKHIPGIQSLTLSRLAKAKKSTKYLQMHAKMCHFYRTEGHETWVLRTWILRDRWSFTLGSNLPMAAMVW